MGPATFLKGLVLLSLFLLSRKEENSKKVAKVKKEERLRRLAQAFWRNGPSHQVLGRFSSLMRALRGCEPHPQIRQYRICWSLLVVGDGRLLVPQTVVLKTMVFSHCFARFVWGVQAPFQRGLAQIRLYRICWFVVVGYTVSVRYKKQCCLDIVFCQISLVGPATFLKGAGGIFSKSPKKNPCVT